MTNNKTQAERLAETLMEMHTGSTEINTERQQDFFERIASNLQESFAKVEKGEDLSGLSHFQN